MISLNQIKTQFGKYKFVAVSVILLLLFIGLIYIKISPKTAPPIIVEIPQSTTAPQQTSQTNISFDGKAISIPKEMSYLNLKPSPFTQEKATQIASTFGFTDAPTIIPAPDGETILLWRDASKSLTAKLNSKTFQYEKAGEIKNAQAVSIDQAALIAGALLKKLGVVDSLNLAPPDAAFLGNLDEGSQKTDIANAKLVSLTYKTLINSFPVILNSSDIIVTSIIDPQGEVKKLDVNLPAYELSTQSPLLPTKPFDELLAQLKSGGGVYLSSVGSQPRFSTDNMPQISQLKITNSDLEYYQEEKNKMLIPVIAFSGQANLSNQQEESVLIIIPILKDTRVTQPKNP